MNYLAHSIISLEIGKKYNKKILYGNFAGNFYKGKLDKMELPKEIIEGIKIHRLIDSITDRDENPLSNVLREKFGIYKGIVSDIVVDHFLAKNFNKFYEENLENIEKNIYDEILENKNNFPKNKEFILLFEWLKVNNALSQYKKLPFIQRVFEGMSKRVRNGKILLKATEEIEKNYVLLEKLSLEEFLFVKNEVFKLIK